LSTLVAHALALAHPCAVGLGDAVEQGEGGIGTGVHQAVRPTHQAVTATPPAAGSEQQGNQEQIRCSSHLFAKVK